MEDWIDILYEYYKKYEGVFWGLIEGDRKDFDCQLMIENNNMPLLLSIISRKNERNGEIMEVKCKARMQTTLDKPYHLDICPMNILRKGLNLIIKKNILVNEEELNKNYQIHSNNKEFTKMILPNSSLSQLLLQNKKICLTMYPVKEEEKLHIIEVVSGINSQYERIEMTDLMELIELCREAYQTLARYKDYTF